MALKLYNEKLFQHIFNSADCITVSSGGYIEESSILGISKKRCGSYRTE